MTTTADEALQQAREDINSSIINITKAINPETWGAEEYNDDFIIKLATLCLELHIIKTKLK